MEFIYKGKTKDIYKLKSGNYVLKFKDTVTGHPSGESDPGGNVVIGEVAGVAQNALKVTKYYFELLKLHKIKSHYIKADLDKNTLTVKPAQTFGKGLEFVVRYVATGSFVRRFGDYIKDGARFIAPIFEATFKDDGRDDPPVTGEILEALGFMSQKDFKKMRDFTVKVCNIVKADLAQKNIDLWDIKLELGLCGGKITLIDEISAGNMRAYKSGKKLSYDELSNEF